MYGVRNAMSAVSENKKYRLVTTRSWRSLVPVHTIDSTMVMSTVINTKNLELFGRIEMFFKSITFQLFKNSSQYKIDS